MEKYLVSVIVPVYNVEKDLRRCLDSIIAQSYHNLQIILVDDGSEDSSGIICDEYAKKDQRIEVLHISNKGVSNARNMGLKKVKGAFVQFVDSDDYLEPDMTSVMIHKMEEGADWVICRYYNIYPKKKKISKRFDVKKEYSQKDYLLQITQEPYHYYYGVLWNKLYKSSIIMEKHIFFNSEIKVAEDFLYNLEYLKNIEKVQCVDVPLYNYNQVSTGSLTRRAVTTYKQFKEKVELRIELYKKYKEVFCQFGMLERHTNLLNEYLLRYYWENKIKLLILFDEMPENEKKKCKKYLEENKILRQCRKEMTYGFAFKKSCYYAASTFYNNGIKDTLRKVLRG